MSGPIRAVALRCWRPIAARAGRAYIAGPALGDALERCRRLSPQGIGATIGYWDRGGEDPRAVADVYLAAIAAVARARFDCYVSIKSPALGGSRLLAGELLDESRRRGVRLHLDALGPETADATWSLIAEARSRVPDLGCTLPGRWRRSARDAERAVARGLGVRLVKGEHRDPAAPDLDPAAGVLALVDRLAGRARRVAVATHDAALARLALGRLRAAGTPTELELLLGLPAAPAMRVAADLGVRVRAYVPWGAPAIPYRVSDARRTPSVLWWLTADVWHGALFRIPTGPTWRHLAAPAPPVHESDSRAAHRGMALAMRKPRRAASPLAHGAPALRRIAADRATKITGSSRQEEE